MLTWVDSLVRYPLYPFADHQSICVALRPAPGCRLEDAGVRGGWDVPGRPQMPTTSDLERVRRTCVRSEPPGLLCGGRAPRAALGCWW